MIVARPPSSWVFASAALLAISGCVAERPDSQFDQAATETLRSERPPNAPPLPPVSPSADLPKSRPAKRDPTPSPQAVVDDVLVTGTSFSGYWVVEGPALIDYDFGILSGITISHGQERAERNICLIHDRVGDLDAICTAGTAQDATGSARDGHVRLNWSAGPGSLIFEGQRMSRDQIDGRLFGGVLGLGLTGAIPARLRRLDDPYQDPVGRPTADALKTILHALTEAAPAPPGLSPKAADEFNAYRRQPKLLPAPDAIRFMGTISNRWRPKQRVAVQDVFRIEGEGRVALCRIEMDPMAQVADFDCRPVAL
jgi:hypothetical protein